jgi:hypothetical protein
MKKFITISFIIASLYIILDSINFGYAIMMFLLAGVIPGTNITMSGEQMFEFFAIITGFVLGRVTAYVIRTLVFRNPQVSSIRTQAINS